MVICNLHSPSMLHAQDAGQDDHMVQVELDQHNLTSDAVPDADHGNLVNDHHGPPAMTVAAPQSDVSVGTSSASYLSADASELASWATAPPIEPPAA